MKESSTAIREKGRIMQFSFQKSAWDESALTHAYTYRFPYTNRFIQHEDCIEKMSSGAAAPENEHRVVTVVPRG